MKKYILLILIVIAAGIIFFFQLIWSSGKYRTQELTKDLALEMVSGNLIDGQCKVEGVYEVYRSCVTYLEKMPEDNIWLITVIYEGFFDDSVRGSRLRAMAVFEKGNWLLQGDLLEDFQCWHGRGHDNFSTELCV